jgi:hypothetical protein
MIRISDDIQKRFEKFLAPESTLEGVKPFYRKWPQYYLDFCHKYQHDIWGRESLEPFMGKLAEKNQPPNLLSQASHAVSIFYKLCQADQVGGKRPAIPAFLSFLQTAASATVSEFSLPRSLSAFVLGGVLSDSTDHTAALSVRDNGGDYQVTNADRTSIFDGLKHEIAIRHSSPRTLRSYSGQKG